jgi:taurine dioxygenase
MHANGVTCGGGGVVRKVLPSEGGDTLFADAAMAFKTLSSSMQGLVTKLNCTHAISKGYEGLYDDEQMDALKIRLPAVDHPCVIAHPVTGGRVSRF